MGNILLTLSQENSAPTFKMNRNTSTSYRRDIDGLRAIAVLAVIGFHCKVPWLRGGFSGVDVFFVISGYLICSIIYKEVETGTFSIARFYERRFKRILPALSVVIVFCLVMAALVLSPVEAHALGNSAIATALSASNFLLMHQTGYFDASSGLKPLLMTWSLAVEEQFYVAFPLIMLLLRSRTQRSLLVILTFLSSLSLFASIYAEFHFSNTNFYFPLTRAWELGAGTLLAVWQAGRKRASVSNWKIDLGGATGIALIIGSIFFYNPQTRFPGYEAIPPVLGAVLVIGSPGSRANRILAIRPLVGIGLISYSLYLWHWPLLSFAQIVSGSPLHPRTTILLMAVAFAVSTASYFFVEKPFRTRGKAQTSTVLIAYGLVVLLLVGVSGIFSFTNGLPSRAPELAKIEFQANMERDHPCLVNRRNQLAVPCIPPPDGERSTMALLGDSHAESISSVVRERLAEKKWQLVVLTHPKCPPTKGTTRWISTTETASCRQFNRDALDYVLSRPDISTVALLAGWGGRIYIPDRSSGPDATQSDEQSAINLKAGVQDEISALEAGGKRVILMDDFPEFSFDPVASVRYRAMRTRRILNAYLLSDEPQQWQSTSQDASLELTSAKRLVSAKFAELKVEDSKLRIVSLKDAFCYSGRCYFSGPSQLYYFDGDHLSDVGAMRTMSLWPDLESSN